MQKFFMMLAKLTRIYSLLICVRIFLTWIPQQTSYDQYGRPIPQRSDLRDILSKLTDWYLNLFRGKKIKLQMGRIDYSPLIALMILNILQSILTIVGTTGTISILTIVVIVVQGLWRYFISYIFGLLLICLVVRWIAGRRQGYQNQSLIDGLNKILQNPVGVVYKIFYKNKNVSDQTLVGASVIFYGLIYFGMRYGLNELLNSLVSKL